MVLYTFGLLLLHTLYVSCPSTLTCGCLRLSATIAVIALPETLLPPLQELLSGSVGFQVVMDMSGITEMKTVKKNIHVHPVPV